MLHETNENARLRAKIPKQKRRLPLKYAGSRQEASKAGAVGAWSSKHVEKGANGSSDSVPKPPNPQVGNLDPTPSGKTWHLRIEGPS